MQLEQYPLHSDSDIGSGPDQTQQPNEYTVPVGEPAEQTGTQA